MGSIRFKLITLPLLILIMTLSACSGSGNEKIQTSEDQPAKESEMNQEFPRTIQDARGTVTIEAVPTKVALTHWGLIDDLLLFELDSVAVALPFTEARSTLGDDVYKPYMDRYSDFEIVGENTTVNLEKLLSYDPDLIIAGSVTNANILDQLSKIATTYVVDESATDVFMNWQSMVTLFGEILGQEEEAQQYIADFDAKLDEVKSHFDGIEGTVAFIQVREKEAWLQGTAYLREYYDGLGLAPPIMDQVEEGAELSLEGLSVVDPDYIFLGYFNYEDDSMPALTDEWGENPVWKQLKAVKNKRIYGFNGQIAFNYGPISKAYGVNEIYEALTP